MGEVYSSRETVENLVVLCDEYGSRWPGTPENRTAVEFMMARLEEYGLEDPHLEPFEMPGWIRGTSKLEVVSPVRKEIPCIALPRSVEGEVEAELVFLGDGPIPIYEERKEEIDGNIVMVTSRTPRGMTRRLHRGEKYSRSLLAGAEGFVFMNHYPAYGPVTGGVSPVIPSVGVSYENGCYLERLIARKGVVRVRIETRCKNLDVESWNVVADIPGCSGDEEHVIYGAHYDGHDIAQGALDDGTGAVCVMEMARALNTVRDKIKRRIRFILFGAEEIGLLGSRAYVSRHSEEMRDVRFMMNFDGSGRFGRQGFQLHSWPELEPFFSDISEALGGGVPVYQDVNSNSDHWPFFMRGIPTGRLRDPDEERLVGGRGFGHTMYDTVDKVDLRLHRECVANAAIAAVRIANTDEWPVKHRTADEVQRVVNEMGTRPGLREKVREYLLSKEERLRPETRAYLKRVR